MSTTEKEKQEPPIAGLNDRSIMAMEDRVHRDRMSLPDLNEFNRKERLASIEARQAIINAYYRHHPKSRKAVKDLREAERAKAKARK